MSNLQNLLWNQKKQSPRKGIKHTEESKAKIREARKKQKIVHSDITKKRIKESLLKQRDYFSNLYKGEKAPSWKGEFASYTAKHIWLNKYYGKAIKCENLDCSRESTTYDWANISGKYRDRSDYLQLYRKCHRKFDKNGKRLEILKLERLGLK